MRNFEEKINGKKLMGFFNLEKERPQAINYGS